MSSNNKVLAILDRARSDAEADANGDAAGHWRLLEEIHNLQLAVETPAERTMRMRFQVSFTCEKRKGTINSSFVSD